MASSGKRVKKGTGDNLTYDDPLLSFSHLGTLSTDVEANFWIRVTPDSSLTTFDSRL